MTSAAPTHQDLSHVYENLTAVIADVIAPAAAEVDRTGAFPRRASTPSPVRASSARRAPPRSAAAGGGLRRRRRDRGAHRRGVRLDGDGRAHALLGGGGARGARPARRARSHRRRPPSEHAGVLRGRIAQPLLGAAGHRDARDGDGVRLDARKSWVTAAGQADSYVWSSRPLAADGPMTLWLVPVDGVRAERAGRLRRAGAARQRVDAGHGGRRASCRADALLGADGAGLDIALSVVLPTLPRRGTLPSRSGSRRPLVDEAAAHLTRTRLEHLGRSLAEQPTTRARVRAPC